MRKLRTTEVCGIKYTEYLAKESDDPDLAGAVAITDHKRARILYNISHYDKATHASTRLHELLHIAMHETGATQRLARELKPGADAADAEEDIVLAITSALAPLFARRVPK